MISFMECRNCGTKLTEVVDFGLMPLANSFKYSTEARLYSFSQKLMMCESCLLVQLNEQPEPKLMFHEDYPFYTGKSKNMKMHFGTIAQEIIDNRIDLNSSALILEIGCNDGTFLENFTELKNVKVIGIDPSKSAADKAKAKGIKVFNSFYDEEVVLEIIKDNGYADVIFASNVICHIPNILTLALNVSRNLKSDGYFIFEEPYLGDVLRLNSFDQVYDEHIFLFSLKTVENIFKPFGLKLVDACKLKTHGGSMRYYLSKNSNLDKTNRLNTLEQWEIDEKIGSLQKLKKFAESIRVFKHFFKEFLQKEIHDKKKSLIGYPATSKSTTILNYCELNNRDILAIYDSTADKIGGFAPGTEIPIRDEIFIKDSLDDFCFLFGWNHHEEISKNLAISQALQNTKWVTHIPEFRVFDNISSLSAHLKLII